MGCQGCASLLALFHAFHDIMHVQMLLTWGEAAGLGEQIVADEAHEGDEAGGAVIVPAVGPDEQQEVHDGPEQAGHDSEVVQVAQLPKQLGHGLQHAGIVVGLLLGRLHFLDQPAYEGPWW